MSEEDTARKNIEIWSKKFRVFEDRCIGRAADLSDQVAVARTRLEATKSDGKRKSAVTELREELKATLRSLHRKWGEEDDDREWAKKIRYGLRAFLEPGKLVPADIICYIKSLTYEIRMYLGPELYAMDGEELEVADRNRLVANRLS